MNITLPWTMASIGCPTFQNRTQMTYFAFSIHLEFSVSPPDNVKRAPEMSSLFHLETLFHSHGFLLIFEYLKWVVSIRKKFNTDYDNCQYNLSVK